MRSVRFLTGAVASLATSVAYDVCTKDQKVMENDLVLPQRLLVVRYQVPGQLPLATAVAYGSLTFCQRGF